VAAVAIAAHELGHAMQDAEEYFPMRVRALLVPAVNIGSNLGWILIMIGLFLGLTQLAWAGVIVFSAGALFALATLPVEFNASARRGTPRSKSGSECRRVNLCRRFDHRNPTIALLCLSRRRTAQRLK
jgi:Zn-dependent membrane protease YugP